MNAMKSFLARYQSVCAGIVAALLAGVCGGFHTSPYNNYVLLAQAFLQGHVAIAQPGNWIDALPYRGSYYIIEAPAPAIFLLPLTAVYGIAANQSLLGVVLCGIAIAAAWQLMLSMQAAFAARMVAALAFFAGTDLFWCASLGDVWLLAHVAAVAMTMLALCELGGRRRAWLVAVWACLAAESRFSMVMALPVYFAMLQWPPSFSTERPRPRGVLPYCAVIGIFIAAWAIYNYARWGQLSDIGYTAWYRQDSAGSPTGSPFDLRYLVYELRSFFLALPEFRASYPWIVSPIGGIALEITSPFLILSFFAKADRRLLFAMWSAVVVTAAPSFVYYVNGYAQFGMRHALDFEPFLFVLVAAAIRRRVRLWQTALVVYSAAVGSWGVWYWHVVLTRP